jgi:hypothetical protein
MNLRTVLFLLVLLLVGAFAALNWDAIIAPAPLSVLVTTVEAPLGLILLCMMALLAVVALGFALHIRTMMLVESRQHARTTQELRRLAEQAEASRLTELQHFLENELRNQTNQTAEVRADLLKRLDLVEHNLKASVEQGGNILAAYIGELEDRLEHETGILPSHPIR